MNLTDISEELRKLLQGAGNVIRPVAQNVGNVLNAPANFGASLTRQALPQIGNAYNQVNNAYQQSAFNPVNQVQAVSNFRASPQTPTLGQAVQKTFSTPDWFYPNALVSGKASTGIPQLRPLEQNVGKYYQNNVYKPATQIGPQLKRIVAPDNTMTGRLGDVAGVGMKGLQIAGNVVPSFVPYTLVFQGYEGLKGASANRLTGGKPSDQAKAFVDAVTGEKSVGLGNAITTDPNKAMALNIAELPLTILATRKSGELNVKAIKENIGDFQMAKSGLDQFGSLKPNEQMKVFDQVNKVLVDILGGNKKEWDKLAISQPSKYLEYASRQVNDALYLVDHPNEAAAFGNRIRTLKGQSPTTPPVSPTVPNAVNQTINDVGATNLQKQLKSPVLARIKPGAPEGLPPTGGTKTQVPVSSDGSIPRGFTTSIQESPNVAGTTKTKINATYIQKPNDQLMGEAKALLNEGASIDIAKVQNVDQKVAATIQEAINLDKKGNHQAAANLYNNLAEQGTELGRGVQAYSLLNKMSPEAISLSAAAKIKKYNLTARVKIPELTAEQQKMISDSAGKIFKMKDSREKNIATSQMMSKINEFIPSTLADKGLTVWKAFLLTSLRTHERNILGNAIHATAETVKDIPATAIDKLMALKTGQRSVTFTTQGNIQGAKQGVRSAADVLRYGFDPEEAISKYDVNKITWGKNPIEQALKVATEVVFRPLAAEDKIPLKMAYARSMYDQAGAAAINAGKNGPAAKAFIENLVQHPTPEMAATAMNDAAVATFHNKTMLSAAINSFKKTVTDPKYGAAAEGAKLVTNIVAPFTGVPTSIAGQMVAYSPVGLVRGALDVGRVVATSEVPGLQRQAAQEIGRGVVGTGLFSLGAYLMSKGLMTGQPKDAAEARQWQLENKPYNSVLLPGPDGTKWRSIGSVGPENLVILAGSKYQQEMGQGGSGDLAKYGAGVGQDFMAQTFLQGVQQPLAAINDPVRYGQSYIGNQASSVVPNIVKDAARSQDTYVRENNNIGDYFRNSIPGLRNQGLIKRDALGNPIMQEPTGGAAFVDLFNSKTPTSNPVVDELSRLNSVGLNSTPSQLTKAQTVNKQKVTLTPTELNAYEAAVGPILQQQLNTLITSQAYQALSDDDKAKAIDKVVSDVRTQYKSTNYDQFGAAPLPATTPKAAKTTTKTAAKTTVKKTSAKKPAKITIAKVSAKKIPMSGFKIKVAKVSKPPKFKIAKMSKVKQIKIKAPKKITLTKK